MKVDITVTISMTVVSAEEQNQLRLFEDDAQTADWAEVKLIGINGDGESISGGLNGFKVERSL